MEHHQNPWTTLESRDVYENSWIRVQEHKVINPNGGEGIYGKVIFKNKAIGIIPLDHDLNTWLVGQYRYTLDEYSWEIPMGGGPLHLDVLTSAKRELKEEIGLIAKKWSPIMRIHTSNSATDEEGFIFLAEDLDLGTTEFEETELLEVKKLPFSEALDMVMSGKITDSLSVAGILKVSRILSWE